MKFLDALSEQVLERCTDCGFIRDPALSQPLYFRVIGFNLFACGFNIKCWHCSVWYLGTDAPLMGVGALGFCFPVNRHSNGGM